jgi:SPP1 gp7 family putative phage head morphogenesis protein
MPAPKPKSALDLEFEAAVAYFRRHRAVTKEEWDKLDEGARRRAVRIASIAHRGVLADVWSGLEKAVADGQSFRTFKGEIAEKLRKKYGDEVAIPAHLETIYRNETQRAFVFGNVTAALHPDVRSQRPFWRFQAIDDSRTTLVCRECDGVIAEAGGAWWREHMPPLHHRCRSTFVSLTPEQAGKLGGVTGSPPKTSGQRGFGSLPDVGDIDALEEQKNAQLPWELKPKSEPPTPTGPPG